jgi:hypothetical protein
MSTIDIRQNFARILRTLEGNGMKTTAIAKEIGYTTTSQLHSALSGDSLLSTKAVIGLIENLNVNPIYLFLGKGEMFLSEDSEVEKLKQENQEWIQRHNEALKTIMGLNEIIKKLEEKNDALIEISSAAIKFHKKKAGEHDDEAEKKEEKSDSKE